MKILKTTSFSHRTRLYNNITFSQSRSHASVPLRTDPNPEQDVQIISDRTGSIFPVFTLSKRKNNNLSSIPGTQILLFLIILFFGFTKWSVQVVIFAGKNSFTHSFFCFFFAKLNFVDNPETPFAGLLSSVTDTDPWGGGGREGYDGGIPMPQHQLPTVRC